MRKIHDKAAEGRFLVDSDIRVLIEAGPDRLAEMTELAASLRKRHFPGRVELCAIINAKSGRCSEDCRFCAQSAHWRTSAPDYGFVGPERIGEAARAMKTRGVSRFGIVISGKIPGRQDFEDLARSVEAVARAGLVPDVSPGILDEGRLLALKARGLGGYHHNLETSRTFFPRVCTTHDYEEDVEAVRTAMRAGLAVCSGGIFGIGETWVDRVELALTLRDLGVKSVPVNFLHPIPGTPCGEILPMPAWEALKTIALLRFLLPDRQIRVCGGRSLVLGGEARPAIEAGASGLMVGDYLTVKGGSIDSDIRQIQDMGLAP